jgi:iron complex outermembrane receptor protein
MQTIISQKSKVESQKSKVESLKVFLTFLLLCNFFISFSQEKPSDSTKVNSLDEVLVSAIRVTKKTPISFSNLDQKEIKNRNLGQDIPVLMNFMPSVVTTSDAGNGVGYTGIRVRGTDATRVNVTLNGIPYNDSESHGTFWVNMPDFASSVQSIQLQRGVGTSTNGAGAFGASLNLLTDSFSKISSAEISNSLGSFNTRKHTVKFSTGLLNNSFELSGRVSNMASDGYVDRASSDLKSYFLQGAFVGKTTLIKALAFGGTEKTYQSWNGIDAETLANNSTYNSAGSYTDASGATRFYDNETDNYQQDHYQLHWNEKINANWSSTVALHYTKGKGYYENFIEDASFADYGITPSGEATKTDLVRQKWLDNDFFGTTFSVNYKKNAVDFIAGGAWNSYEGDHFGKVIWVRTAFDSELGDRYYDNFGNKTDANVFAKINYQLSKKWLIYGDLQYRNVHYKANGVQTSMVDDTFRFFNPKAGVNFDLDKKNAFYFSFAKAQREPNRTDYEGGNVRPEKLNDFELGWRYTSAKTQLNTNLYYMAYTDQLILTGGLDDVGNPIRSNSEKSYRLGLEVDANFEISNKITLRPNFTISQNKNIDLSANSNFIGTKDIAYSPGFIASNMLIYKPFGGFQFSILSKFVSDQYLNNIELPEAKLADYFVNDLNVSYEITPKSIFKSITISGLLNNLLNKKYVSNGSMWDVYPYYYPQAGTNFFLGLTLKF